MNCLFGVVREGQKFKRTLVEVSLGLFVRAKKLKKGHLFEVSLFKLFVRAKKVQKVYLLNRLFGVVREGQKIEKGHLFKCLFGVVREGQKP